jgi:hypothetical protein
MNMVRTKCDRRPNAKPGQASRVRLADEFASEGGPPDAGDPDGYGLKRGRAAQERDPDQIAGPEPADVLMQLNVLDALSAAHRLNILKLHAVAHAQSFFDKISIGKRNRATSVNISVRLRTRATSYSARLMSARSEDRLWEEEGTRNEEQRTYYIR